MKLRMTCPMDEAHEVVVTVVPVDGVEHVEGCEHAAALEESPEFCRRAYETAVEIIRWQDEAARDRAGR